MPTAVVVGTGFGGRVHVPALRAAGFDVGALVGQDAAKTKRRADRLGVPLACTSLTEALAATRADAVTIATPPDTHAALAIEACEAGKHVICEKPFALDAKEAAAMLAAAEAAGVTHLVGHEFRWAPERALMARSIADGLIGEPRFFTIAHYVPLVADPEIRMPAWWFDAALGGGYLGASGSHLVDQLRVWFGEFESVSAALPSVRARPGGAEDSFIVRITMRSGVGGVLQQTAASWAPSVTGLTMVAGTEGTLELSGAVALSDRSGRRPLRMPDDLMLPASLAASDDPREQFTYLELSPWTRLCEVLHAGVRGETPDTAVPIPTFVDGVAEMVVLDAIRASASTGKEMPCTF
jgi:predicted dehydrogenase